MAGRLQENCENLKAALDIEPRRCNNSYSMAQNKTPKTMTEILRQAIADSGMTFIGIERETGITRQSLMKFARGEQSLRLDLADRLAAYFGIECRPARRKGC